jgi:hypothetical protein
MALFDDALKGHDCRSGNRLAWRAVPRGFLLMKMMISVLAVSLFGAGLAQADCVDAEVFSGLGQIITKGGGTYFYGETVGGPAVMRGSLQNRPDNLPDVTFDPEQGYDIGFGGAGLALRLAPDAVAALPLDSELLVTFWATSALPQAVPGKVWQGKVEASIQAMPPTEHNMHTIGTAMLTGTYSFLTEKSAEISGCTYRIIPVEMTLTDADETVLRRRILYFPDLGVSAITLWGPDADGAQRKSGVIGFASGS